MQQTRIARLQAAILEELSVVLPREIKDPRVPPITLTRVELTPDAGMARVYFMLLGSLGVEEDEKLRAEKERKVKDCIEGLASASGFLKRHLQRALQIRTTPDLLFREDRGMENTLRVNELLGRIAQEKSPENSEAKSDKPEEK
jgi:ribosome-binding factor A